MSEVRYTVFSDLGDEEEEGFVEESGELIPSESNESFHYDPVMMTPAYHIGQGERALEKLKFVVEESGWKKALTVRATTVYSKNGIDDDKVPVFMCEHIIENFTPQSIFAVVGMRKLWDPWYEEGNLVENLDETTSLTYMVMQGVAGTRTRDLSLVEKIQCTNDGTIYFATTSVETNKVPQVVDRIRANIHLNGWIIKPISENPPRTKVTYVLQTKVNGWIPSVVAKKYLLKRPLVVHVIDQYLQKNGPPPMVISTSPTISNHPSRSTSSASSKMNIPHLNNLNSNGRNNMDWTDHQRNRVNRKKEIRRKQSKLSSAPLNENTPVDTNDDKDLDHQSPKVSLEVHEQHPSSEIPTSPKRDQFVQNRSIDPIQVQPTNPVQPITRNLTLPQPPPPPLPIKHRYTDAVNIAVATFKDNVKTLEGWNYYTENKGVKIYTKDVTGRSTPIIRGDYTLSGSFTSDDFLAVIKNLDLRKLWDDRYEDGEYIKLFDGDNTLSRVSMKGTFPISGRDFSLCGTVEHDSESCRTLFVTTSIIDPAIPEVKKYVRGHVHFTGWQIDSKFDLNGNTKALDIIYIVDTELKLEIIPQSILKSISTGTPLVIQKIDEMMQNIGFPPYVINSPSSIISEKLDPKSFQYNLTLAAKNDSVKKIRFSKKMYPNGLDISITPINTKVELLQNNLEIIRITFLPSDVFTDKIQIKITKYRDGFKMTYNGNNKIPLAQNKISTIANYSEESEEPVIQLEDLPIEEVTKETVKQSQNKRHSRKISQPIDPNATLVEEDVDISGNRDSNPPRKQKRISFADSPSFINPENFFREENKISEHGGHGGHEEREEYEEYEYEEDMMPFIESPIENNVYNVTKDIIIISDEVKFNTYQAGIMFIGMVLSYYSGKLSCYLLY